MMTAQTFKAIRALRGMTQAQLAYEARCSPNSVAEFEAGKRELRTDTVRKLCEVLKVEVRYVIDGKTEITGP